MQNKIVLGKKLLSKIRNVGFAPVVFSFLLGGISGGVIVWGALSFWDGGQSKSGETYSVRNSGYRFINPLLECESAEKSMRNRPLLPFKHKIEDYVKKRIDGDITHVSVYFRDLNDGPWFGINEKEKFSPASLLKVPVMIAYLKLAESNPQILKQKIICKRDDYDLSMLKKGKKYMIDELISLMIIYSDNGAMDLLVNNISEEQLDKVLIDIGIIIPKLKAYEDYMSVKEYASFFRILFNSSYLSRAMSEKALEILSKSEFKHGLSEGVPQDVAIAHKYGSRDVGKFLQLHDCGIVYYPDHPYLLCAMTRGKKIELLSEVIGDVSRLVYNELDSHYR